MFARLLGLIVLVLNLIPLVALAQVDVPPGLDNPSLFADARNAVALDTFADRAQVKPGEEFTLALRYIPFGNEVFTFHIYGAEPSLDGMYFPSSLTMDPADGVEWSDPVFPPGEAHEDQMWLPGQPVVLITGKLAADAAPGPRAFTGKTAFMACTEDMCLSPSEVVVQWEVEVVPADTEQVIPILTVEELVAEAEFDAARYSLPEDAGDVGGGLDIAAESEGTPQTALATTFDLETVEKAQPVPLWKVLLLALVGGLILNVMPCVLPVVSIKIISLVRDVEKDPKRVVPNGLLFSLGIVVTFLVGAIIIAAIQLAGSQFDWGGQFQSPAFNIVMATIIFAFGLSLAGVFVLKPPTALTGASEQMAQKEGYVGSFFKGVLATVLGTPCVGPFLGPALAYALTRQWTDTLLIFTVVGLGMALPYVLMLPFIARMGRRERGDFSRKLQESKNWLIDFERIMAFLMFITAIYLLNILQGLMGGTALIWILIWLTGVALAAWLWGRISPNKRQGIIWGLIAVLLTLGVAGGLALPRAYMAMSRMKVSTGMHAGWEEFSLESLQRYIGEGKTVLVDFTADWCPNCKYNESTALNIDSTMDLKEDLDIVFLYADYTSKDAAIGKVLRQLGYSSVPLTAIFPADDPTRPILLDGVYSPQRLHDALRQAAAGQGATAVEPPAEAGLANPSLFADSKNAVALDVYADRAQVRPGDEFTLAVRYLPYGNENFQFHIYGSEPSLDGMYFPTALAVDPVEGVEWSAPAFPPGEPHDTQMWWPGQPVVLITGKLAADAPPGMLKFTGATAFMACTEDMCLSPSEVPLSWEIEVVPPDFSGEIKVLTSAELTAEVPFDENRYTIPEDLDDEGSVF